MSRRLYPAVLLAAMVLLAGAAPAWAQGCSGCRAALEFSAEGRLFAASLDSGILMLMGAPYALLGGAGFVIFRAYRKNRIKSAKDSAPL